MNQETDIALRNLHAMRQLLASEGWEIMAADLQAQMMQCVSAVMEREDDHQERDRLITRYRALKRCLEMPTRTMEGAESVLEHSRARLGDEDSIA